MRTTLLSIIVVAMLVSVSPAQIRRPTIQGNINLPYSISDNSGTTWMIYPGGWLQQQGNMPLYGQAATLIINGNGIAGNVNQAHLDEKTGELIFDGLSAAGVSVTRRILVKQQEGYIRYIDILKNPTQQPMNLSVQLNSNVNYGIQGGQMISDPQMKDRIFATAVMLNSGRPIVEVYGSKGAKNLPKLDVPPNNNFIRATQQLTIAPGKQAAIFHLHAVSTTPEAAVQFASNLKESRILGDLSTELRRSIVNITELQAIGDREVLRGELFDVVELRGGDQLNGTIAEKSFKLQTFYGTIELQADRVVGLLNVGQFRPRQLLVTVDGEVFGGNLAKDTLAIQLSSGQTTQVPLAQISRAGYRKRSGEPDEWTFDRPMIHLRSGERMLIAMPGPPIEVMTRYGQLKLKPEIISAISFQSDEHGVHQITLTDGSSFAGLAMADHFDMQLIGTATQQAVAFPAAMLDRIQLHKPAEDDDNATELRLSNHDRFVGKLAGQLKLDTNFDTISLNGAELRSLTHAAEGGLDVQATLWDQTTLSGQLRDAQINCDLKCGLPVKIAVAMLDRYSNPEPNPSDTMLQRIKSIVAELSADDWKRRESAEAQLVSMGPSVAAVLKGLSANQPPEAQQRIEVVLRQFESKPDPAVPGVQP